MNVNLFAQPSELSVCPTRPWQIESNWRSSTSNTNRDSQVDVSSYLLTMGRLAEMQRKLLEVCCLVVFMSPSSSKPLSK